MVLSGTFQEHFKRLNMVLEAVRKACLSLKAEMCRSGYNELKFIGPVVSVAEVRLEPEKTSAAADIQSPKKNKPV